MSKLKIDMKQQSKITLIVIALFVLSSCQSLNLNNYTQINRLTKFNMSTLEAKLQKFDKWTASGVIGVRYNGKANSADYIYNQDGDAYSIKLYWPLGIGNIEVQGNKNKVIFINSKRQQIEASNVENLMIQQLGWYVPIDLIKYWIKGVPFSNKYTNRQKYNNNLTHILLERGWKIDYKDYKMFDEYPLPTKIKMTRDSLYLKMVIKSWQV